MRDPTVNEGAARLLLHAGHVDGLPHVAGVAALIVSRYGDSPTPKNATMKPGKVAEIVEHTADPQPCPTETRSGRGVPLVPRPRRREGAGLRRRHEPQLWYGDGQVNALSAIGG